MVGDSVLDRVKFLIASCDRKHLLVVLASVLLIATALSGMALAVENNADRDEVARQVAQNWINVGTEQYDRGFYAAAEQSFLQAQEYKQYLSLDERATLNQLLSKTQTASGGRDEVLRHIQIADELAKQGELIRAKAHLEKVKGSEFLSQQEQLLVLEGLKKIDNKFSEQKKEIVRIYNESVELYLAGEFEKAKCGFVQVAQSGLFSAHAGKTAEDYLAKINSVLPTTGEPLMPQPAEEITETENDEDLQFLLGQQYDEPIEVVAAQPAMPMVSKEPARDGAYIDEINRRRNILRSHTEAVVNDAVGKSQSYVSEREFEKAKNAVLMAEQLVKKNHLSLGDELCNQYITKLKELTEKINASQDEAALKMQEQKQIEAIESQKSYREKTEADRQKRIAELFENATAYQKQQRYEDALDQLESLLMLDTLNDNALILKQTLVDTVNFRRQLELQRESNKERVDILVKTDEASIPYAEEFRLPKNWKEIVASPYRRAEEAIGQDPADAAVYKQLEQIVNLSDLAPEMSFNEAKEILKNSVEPPLNIVVLWRDLLDNADIDQATPINMDGISAVPLGKGLEFLLNSVSGGFAEIDYVVGSGVVTVATVDSLPSELETLVYDITDLLGSPANFYAETGGGGGSGSTDSDNIGGGFTDDDQEERSSEEMTASASSRGGNLALLIRSTIEPDSWYEEGGEGMISIYEGKKLIVRQKREVHNKIVKLLKEMRKSLGHQVAIEARFLLVGENFLEDIGLDLDFTLRNIDHFSDISVAQGSLGFTAIGSAGGTGVPGSLAGAISSAITSGGVYGSALDDLQVRFLVRATQAHRDASSLTAPKVSVLSGESAYIRIQKVFRYASNVDIEREISGTGDNTFASYSVTYDDSSITSGTVLNVTPTITPDKKHVLLNITAQLEDFLGFNDQVLFESDSAIEYSISFPETEVSRVQTRVSVPDGGTLLLGGQKLTAEIEREAGVPVLSKIPLIGRLFSNRSKVKDSKILLILVKPTIILQEEAEAKAVAGMENAF